MIVVDASVAVKWFLDEERRDQARKLFHQPAGLVAPDLVVWEITNVLRRKARMGLMTEKQVYLACATIRRCFTELVAAESVVGLAARLSFLLDHSVYDCAYLACAQMLDAPLVTADEHFVRKVERQSASSARIVSLADF